MTIEKLQELAIKLKKYDELKSSIDSLKKENDFKNFFVICEVTNCNISDNSKNNFNAAVEKFKNDVN